MASPESSTDPAAQPLAPGPLLGIASATLQVSIAPAAGGRIAQMTFEGREWLCGYSADNASAIAWGCYPMLPWAGRIRQGRFRFGDSELVLPANFGAHAIHGVAFARPWKIKAADSSRAELALDLPQDESWPFGGAANQRISIAGNTLHLELSVHAGARAMPRPVLGWHPWFARPDKLDFTPVAHYRRDAEGIAASTAAGTPASPWDDCFINTHPVVLHRMGQVLELRSDCDHWVVFDERAHSTCVEPQTGPPDAFNLRLGEVLEPGEAVSAWFSLEWRNVFNKP